MVILWMPQAHLRSSVNNTDEQYGVKISRAALIKSSILCLLLSCIVQFCSQLVWGSRGREFDSRHSDQKIEIRT